MGHLSFTMEITKLRFRAPGCLKRVFTRCSLLKVIPLVLHCASCTAHISSSRHGKNCVTRVQSCNKLFPSKKKLI